MLSRIPWPTLARNVLFTLAALCCLGALYAFDISRIRWPSGPNAAFRLQSLADMATAMTCFAVAAAGFTHNAGRIGRGETLWRAPAALAGGAGVFLAMLSVWLLGEIAVGLFAEPIRSYDQTWLLGAATSPLLGTAAAGGWLLLIVCFGERPPAATDAFRLLARAFAGAALAAGLAVLAAAIATQEAGEALAIAAPTALGLIGLSAAIAANRRGGWAFALKAALGYLAGAFCALSLSLIVAGFVGSRDPRELFLLAIFFGPIGLALLGGYVAALSLAAGRAADHARRLRRAFA